MIRYPVSSFTVSACCVVSQLSEDETAQCRLSGCQLFRLLSVNGIVSREPGQVGLRSVVARWPALLCCW